MTGRGWGACHILGGLARGGKSCDQERQRVLLGETVVTAGKSMSQNHVT